MPSLMDYLAWAAGGPLEARPTRGNSITDLQLPVIEPPPSSLHRADTVAARLHQVACAPSRSPAPPPVPKSPPKKAVYFDEGEGYLLVKDLASGADGNASLVRSRWNGMLYVRKEELYPTDCPYEANFRITPPGEIINARGMSQVFGVYRSHGWTRWVMPETNGYYDVTYWKYYNLGSLSSFTESITKGGRSIPEFWSAEWLMQMLNTLINIHKANLAHLDCHSGNWLLDVQGNRTPSIVLADMGRSKQRRGNGRHHEWVKHCSEDFLCALGAICDPVSCRYDEYTGAIEPENSNPIISERFLIVLNEFSQVLRRNYQNVNDLHDRIGWIVLQVQQHRLSFGRAVSPFIIPPETHPEYMTGSEIIEEQVECKGVEYKQWRRAFVSGKHITTKQQYGLVKQISHYRGEWYSPVRNGPAKWKVDGV